jgi:predicted patatin/cPLA2 family phospholipase
MGALEALANSPEYERVSQLVGSSAGALNSTYVASGQAREGVDMYVEDLSNRQFINPIRVWKIVDIDYLIDDVLKERHPLHVQAFRTARPLVRIVATEAESGAAVEFTNRQQDLDVYEVLRATAALPAFYNRRIKLGEREYVDGGVADGLPVLRALDRPHDLLIVISTRPLGYRSKEHSMAYIAAGKILSRGQSEKIKTRIKSVDAAVNTALAYLSDTPGSTIWESPGSSIRKLADGRIIAFVSPSDVGRLVSRTTSEQDRLQDCAEMGRSDMAAGLTGLLQGKLVS